MGCDIHMFVEHKTNDEDWKIHKGHICEDRQTEDMFLLREVSATGRSYALFAELAGVRGHGPQAKGLPADVSKEIIDTVDDWGVDGHSHSWITLEAFQRILSRLGYEDTDRTDMFYDWEKEGFDDMPPPFTTIVAACKKEQEELEAESILLDTNLKMQHRLVFFFDN